MAENLTDSDIHLILVLGNPGGEYERTYHNVGVLFGEYILSDHHASPFKHPSHKSFGYSEIGNGLVLVKSLTYMNESGLAASQALAYFDLKPSQLLIAHDDSDMNIGTYKISYAQRSGGHNGINSIIDHLGTNEFWRLKIGVRDSREEVRKKANDFVLSPISPAHMKELEKVFQQAQKELTQRKP